MYAVIFKILQRAMDVKKFVIQELQTELNLNMTPIEKIDCTLFYVYRKGKVALSGNWSVLGEFLNSVLGESRKWDKTDIGFIINALEIKGYLIDYDIDEATLVLLRENRRDKIEEIYEKVRQMTFNHFEVNVFDPTERQRAKLIFHKCRVHSDTLEDLIDMFDVWRDLI